jgi:hypothetical protein
MLESWLAGKRKVLPGLKCISRPSIFSFIHSEKLSSVNKNFDEPNNAEFLQTPV